jgi:hypothetical protein
MKSKQVNVKSEENIEDDDLKIELEPLENEKADEIIVAKAEDEPKAEAKAQKEAEIPLELGIQELKRKLEEEKNARIAAETTAKQAHDNLKTARSEVDDTNLKLIDNAIETVDRDVLLIKQNLKSALAEQNVDAIVELQSELSKAIGRKDSLEQGKTAYEQKMKEIKSAPAPVADPVEALAAQLTPRSAAWVRSHPEYARDKRMFDKMIAAHQLTVSDGIQADSDEYFQNVESILKIRKPEPKVETEHEESALSEASAPTQRRSSPPAAPVSRAPATNSGNRPNVVRLTSAEREMASMLGMTDKEYAKNKVDLIKEGKMQ